jgi:hypothetical protein
MREYKADVAWLQKELMTHKGQAASVKNKYAGWNADLQKKLREFREQKRTWTYEVSELRTANTRLKVNSVLLIWHPDILTLLSVS